MAALAGCVVCGFAWGYAVRARGDWPRLRQFHRGDYAVVWDALSTTANRAALAATGDPNEEALRATGREVAERIRRFVSIDPNDTLLEIGCGVGRIGWALAPLCREWIGCDISRRMLHHAQQRLVQFDNVRFRQLSQPKLEAIADTSVDLVYCTNMLPHLDEMERWQYVREAHRVLRPGGSLYVDTIALDSEEGWRTLANNHAQRQLGVDPPYTPLPSTVEELTAYFRNAGFEGIRTELQGSLLIATAAKNGTRAYAAAGEAAT